MKKDTLMRRTHKGGGENLWTLANSSGDNSTPSRGENAQKNC